MSTLVDQLLKTTEIKDLEKKQLDILTKFIPGGFMIQRADGSCSFKYISEGFANMFGYTLEEFMEVSGGTMKGIADVGSEMDVISQLENSMKDGETYCIQYRVRCKNGYWKYVEDRGQKITNSDGENEYWCVLLDIDEAKKLEEKERHLEAEKKLMEENEKILQEMIRYKTKYNEQLEKEVKKKTRSLVRMQNDIILSMADTVEDRDSNTGGHIRRTSECVRVFTEGLQNNPFYAKKGDSFFECVIKAAPLHDFGKIAVDDAILRKPGKYTQEEYEIMKTHPEKGAHIVAKILHNSDDMQFRKVAENVAHYHHEKWDGTGYPAGLRGEEIPLEARIMALADVFDALVSKRCYKEKYSFDKAFSIIEESLGKHFDAKLGKLFIQQREALEACYQSLT